MINATKSKIHWNYFIALEQDLETVSRYIEFNELNFNVYSIELARILFAAASEVDVMAKLLCKRLQPTTQKCKNINDYRRVILDKLPDIVTMEITIDRYGFSFKPWENWSYQDDSNPDWWGAYNKVKHKRDIHFDKATLKNAINSLGSLLILVYYYYSYELSGNGERLSQKDTTLRLEPKSTLLRLPDDYYYGHLII